MKYYEVCVTKQNATQTSVLSQTQKKKKKRNRKAATKFYFTEELINKPRCVILITLII